MVKEFARAIKKMLITQKAEQKFRASTDNSVETSINAIHESIKSEDLASPLLKDSTMLKGSGDRERKMSISFDAKN